jgi:hypothetical protein
MGRTILSGESLRAAVLLLAVAGCGGKGFIRTTGTVTLDGEPLDEAVIVFVAETQGSDTPTGRSQSDGTFSLRTGKAEGAAPGAYKVVVNKYDSSPKAKGKKSVLPSIYSSAKTTPLRCTVPHDGPVLLELKSK